MQPYDIFMLVVLVGATAFGAWKGMAWQLASIASVLLSAVVALRCAGLVAPHISAAEPWNLFLAMAVLFIATSLGVWIAFRYVSKAIDRVKLKEFDRQMGALFGATKGVLYCLVLTFFAVTLSETTRQYVLDSRSGYYAAVLIHKGTPMMPERANQMLGKYIERLKEGLEQDPSTTTPEELIDEMPLATEITEIADMGLPFPALTDQSGTAGQPPTQETYAWPPPALEQDARQLVDDQMNHIETAYHGAVDRAVNDSANRFRETLGNTAEDLQNRLKDRFDRFGRRIQQRPMEPIQ